MYIHYSIDISKSSPRAGTSPPGTRNTRVGCPQRFIFPLPIARCEKKKYQMATTLPAQYSDAERKLLENQGERLSADEPSDGGPVGSPAPLIKSQREEVKPIPQKSKLNVES